MVPLFWLSFPGNEAYKYFLGLKVGYLDGGQKAYHSIFILLTRNHSFAQLISVMVEVINYIEIVFRIYFSVITSPNCIAITLDFFESSFE